MIDRGTSDGGNGDSGDGGGGVMVVVMEVEG